MKLFFFLVSLLSVSHSALTQYDPNFSSDGLGSLWNNPASFGGINSHSVQLAGIVTKNKEDDYAVINHMVSGEFQISKNINSGLLYTGNAFGFARKYNVKIPINYAFNFKNTKLLVGISAGFENGYYRSKYINIPQVYDSDVFPSRIDLDFGVYTYGEKYYLGMSITHVQGQLFRFDDIYAVDKNYYVNAGYNFTVFKRMSVFPSIEVHADRYVTNIKLMNYFQFADDQFSFAVGYRVKEAVLAGITGRYSRFKLAYFYSFLTNKLAAYHRNSHEVRLSYNLPRFQR